MEPIQARGNMFWRGADRFLIKGMSYVPQSAAPGTDNERILLDPLSDGYLPHLERDIPVFKQLGLNTVQVTGIDPTLSHDNAMHLLQAHGIYVIVKVGERLRKPQSIPNPATFDSSRYYTLALMRRVLRTIDQLADHFNLLCFMFVGSKVHNYNLSPMAMLIRAAIRDCKAFLHVRGGRVPPVGVDVPDIVDLKLRSLQYFTAGPAAERVDFFAHQCYSWAGESTFRISGWQNMVQVHRQYPLPMFLSEYGTNATTRVWQETGCLYSPDMTGVFSGGCAYTYLEHGNGYGVVEISDDDRVMRKEGEFVRLKRQLEIVNQRSKDEVFGDAECRDYDSWTGTFPPTNDRWNATSVVPVLQASIDKMWQEIRREREQTLAEGVERLRLDEHP